VCSLPALRHYLHRIVTLSSHHAGNLPGQVLVDFDARSLAAVALERNEVCVVYRFGGEFQSGLDIIAG
jgi:hypothetical protein